MLTDILLLGVFCVLLIGAAVFVKQMSWRASSTLSSRFQTKP